MGLTLSIKQCLAQCLQEVPGEICKFLDTLLPSQLQEEATSEGQRGLLYCPHLQGSAGSPRQAALEAQGTLSGLGCAGFQSHAAVELAWDETS